MVLGGIQKLTLLDYPEKTACTLFTVGCNFNCGYCQNASLIDPAGTGDTITASEVVAFLKTRTGLLDGVCISGGEPLIHDDLEAFIDEIKGLGFLVKLDTNGSYPDKLEKLIASAKLDYVAMDIKNRLEKYATTIGKPGYDASPIKESVSLLLLNPILYEFRTTVVREYHTEEDLLSIARWISGAEKFYLQVFRDSEGVAERGLHSFSEEEMQQILSNIKEILPKTELRGM